MIKLESLGKEDFEKIVEWNANHHLVIGICMKCLFQRVNEKKVASKTELILLATFF